MKYLIPLLIITFAAAASDFEPRLETLKFHLDRLGAVTVPDESQGEKDAKLSSLSEAIKHGASEEELFDQLYRDMDAVREWLLTHAEHQPTLAAGSFEETEEDWVLSTPELKMTWSKGDFSVRFETAEAAWDLIPCDTSDLKIEGRERSLLDARERKVEEFRTSYSVGLLATLSDFPEAKGLKIFLSLHLIGNEAVFEVAAVEEGAKIQSLYWPKSIRFDTNSPDDFSVIPFMQGALIPANWEKKMKYEGGLCETRFLYMPWWGQIRDGHGIQSIIETTYDGGAKYVHPEGGPTAISPRWYSSLGSLRYPRRIRCVFDDEATYVSMAKRYRRFAKENGHFVSLREVVRNPAVDEVIGKPVIHVGALYHFVPESQFFNQEKIEVNHNLDTFDRIVGKLKGLKERGLEDAYVHLDGWGFRGYDSAHPDVLPAGEEQGGWEGLRNFSKTCEELGYLFAVHDNYRDFYLNALSFNEQLALRRENGMIPRSSTWCGGDQSLLSARFAPGHVRRNHDLFAANGVNLGGAYLDVFAVADLDESFQEANPMSREDCAKFRLESFNLLRARGYVISSEEPVDFAVPSLDLVHHGPYPTFPNLGGGEATGTPVPLFNLVYHDSILLPWEMGEDGGWGIPKGDAGWLHCLLNSGLPYVSPGASEEQIEKVNEFAAVARRLAFEEMVDHEFLDESRRKQRTTYSDGTKVTVDFETKEYWVE